MSGYPQARTDLEWAPDAMKGYVGRDAVSAGTRDPLLASAAAYEIRGRRVVLLGLDTLVVTREFTAAVRRELAQEGVVAELLLLAASHTHGGPDLFNWWRPFDDGQLARRTLEQTVGAARRAIAAMTDVELQWGEAPLDHVSVNRRDERHGVIDPVVSVLAARDRDADVIGLTVNFACHPVAFDYANDRFTADWVHDMRMALSAVYPRAQVVFLNGAAGNINPARHPFEQRLNVYDPQTLENRPVYWGGPAAAARVGRSVAGAAVVATERAAGLDWRAPSGRAGWVDLPLKRGAELERFLDFMAFADGYRARILRSETLRTEAQRIEIGPLQLFALPGEPFAELGLAIKDAASGHGPVAVVGFANDDVRYVMTDDAYVPGQYETVGTPLAAGSAALLIETALAMLPATA
jgi:hypothetical protein